MKHEGGARAPLEPPLATPLTHTEGFPGDDDKQYQSLSTSHVTCNHPVLLHTCTYMFWCCILILIVTHTINLCMHVLYKKHMVYMVYMYTLEFSKCAADLNLPSVSLRSEERQVKSTENFSTFTFRIRAWMVIPICPTHTHATYSQ